MSAPPFSHFTLTKRADFLAAASSGRKWVAPAFILQIRAWDAAATYETPFRYGLTATKKIGNAVLRNRVRRRLRALAREVLWAVAAERHDYVLIARAETATRPSGELQADLRKALKRLKLEKA